MTGTPLQNNARELFNLLHFLDDTIDAAELEEKYADMTSENVKELHDQIRPFILRRTKAQVLTFLPPLGQIILPISMSHLQKQLYKSILSKRPELLKALFTSDKSLKQQERANLSNILMQLRKCLCHPFVYSREIEERTDVAAVSHRNLVEASAKLSLLELLLPKLKERGHRVLIFSQFLDMLNIVEDFLDGMQMAYQRLDGQMGSLEKQKRIDQFNAPDSPLFAFLLSTRAGGVGINLATARLESSPRLASNCKSSPYWTEEKGALLSAYDPSFSRGEDHTNGQEKDGARSCSSRTVGRRRYGRP
jgi:chromodomain-helicase-DNA-binding protein 4